MLGKQIFKSEKLVVKKLEFVAYASSVCSIEQAIEFVNQLEFEQKSVSFPYAFRINKDESVVEETQDRGELFCGTIIMNVIRNFNLSGIIVAVTRNDRGFSLCSKSS